MNYKNSVQLYSCTTVPVPVQIPEYNESILGAPASNGNASLGTGLCIEKLVETGRDVGSEYVVQY